MAATDVLCSIVEEGVPCTNPAHSRGYCSKHYQKIWAREKKEAAQEAARKSEEERRTQEDDGQQMQPVTRCEWLPYWSHHYSE